MLLSCMHYKGRSSLDLSRTSVFLLTLLATAVVLSLLENVKNVIVLLLVALPVGLLVFFGYWRHCRELVSADTLVKMFFLGLIPGVIFASLLEMFVTIPLGMICFWDQLPSIMQQLHDPDTEAETISSLSDLNLKHNLGFYLFLLLESYAVAALVEESVKSAVATCSRSPYDVTQPTDLTFTNHRNPVATLVYFVAAGCGFAVMENFGYSSAMHGLQAQSLVAGVRSIVSLPLHCLCAALTAAGLIGKDLHGAETWRKILLPAVFVHGTFDLLVLVSGVTINKGLSEEMSALLALFQGLFVVSLGFVWLQKELERVGFFQALERQAPVYELMEPLDTSYEFYSSSEIEVI